MRRQTFFASALCCVVTLLHSCSSINCPIQTAVSINYALRQPTDRYGENRQDTLATGDTLWIWTQRSDGTDTLLLNRGTRLTTFSLPVSSSHPEDMLVFYVADSLGYSLDTLWIKKEDQPHFENVDCQAIFFHTLTAVRSTHNRIDSVVINTADVTFDTEPTHLYLFLHEKQ